MLLTLSAPAASSAPRWDLLAAQWLAQTLKLPPDAVRLQAPDPRVRPPACAQAPQMDLPFDTPTTVRVQCMEPRWQLYLSAQIRTDEPRAAPVPADTLPRHTASGGAVATTGLQLLRSVTRGALLAPASAEKVALSAPDRDHQFLRAIPTDEPLEAIRDLPSGTVLRHTDVRPAVLVRQGQWVTMTVGQDQGFVVTVRLEALQDGRLGDRVALRNPETGRTVSGVVSSLGATRGP